MRERGSDAVSLRGVAERIGVSPSAAYNHFPDKNALMQAVADRGAEILDEAMTVGFHDADEIADPDLAARQRLLFLGRAYAGFATTEPHLFRHTFGPWCANPTEDMHAENAGYQLLCTALDDLDARGLLRPGCRDGLDLVMWTAIHGFSYLVLEGYLPFESGQLILESIQRLAFADQVTTANVWARQPA